MEDDFQCNEIAIVGIACRFPDADTPQGVPETVLDSGDYVPAGATWQNAGIAFAFDTDNWPSMTTDYLSELRLGGLLDRCDLRKMA